MSEEYSGYGKRRESAARSEHLQPPGLARRRRENRRDEKRRVKQADGTAKKERECKRAPMESLTKVRIQGSPIALAQREKQGAGWAGSRDCLHPQLVHGQGVGRSCPQAGPTKSLWYVQALPIPVASVPTGRAWDAQGFSR